MCGLAWGSAWPRAAFLFHEFSPWRTGTWGPAKTQLPRPGLQTGGNLRTRRRSPLTCISGPEQWPGGSTGSRLLSTLRAPAGTQPSAMRSSSP